MKQGNVTEWTNWWANGRCCTSCHSPTLRKAGPRFHNAYRWQLAGHCNNINIHYTQITIHTATTRMCDWQFQMSPVLTCEAVALGESDGWWATCSRPWSCGRPRDFAWAGSLWCGPDRHRSKRAKHDILLEHLAWHKMVGHSLALQHADVALRCNLAVHLPSLMSLMSFD